MAAAFLQIPRTAYSRLLKHLLPRRPRSEEAAFVFCRVLATNSEVQFQFLDLYPVPAGDFEYKSMFGIVLNDLCRAKVIKRAHDLNASLLELHSHPKASTAEFSPSDRSGFAEFVPHVWWRLKQRPYAAIVVSPAGFDSLFWITNATRPDGVLQVNVGERRLIPTGRTFEVYEGLHE
jgi:hypothetical protein